jgi:hypothetical protein
MDRDCRKRLLQGWEIEMSKYFAFALLVALTAALPASAQDAFQVGQKVKSIDGSPPVACTTQDDLGNYKRAGMACAMGDPASCATTKDFETRKVCGIKGKVFVVVSIDPNSGLMQISSPKKPTVTYWTNQDDYKLAK